MGEAQSYGSMHTNFWSQVVDLTHLLKGDSDSNVSGISQENKESKEYKAPWLPVDIEIAIYRSHGTSTGSVYAQGRERSGSGQSGYGRGRGGVSGGGGGKADKDKLVISGRLLCSSDVGEKETVWVVFDGAIEVIAVNSASRLREYEIMSGEGVLLQGWEVYRYNLFAVVSHVVTSVIPTTQSLPAAAITSANTSPLITSLSGATAETPKHSILHTRRKTPSDIDNSRWWMFNDFVLQPSEEKEAVSFSDWRHPSTLFFSREDYNYDTQVDSTLSSIADSAAATSPTTASSTTPVTIPSTLAGVTHQVPSSVLLLPSLSQIPCIRLVNSTGQTQGQIKTNTNNNNNSNSSNNSGNNQREKDREREEEQYKLPPLPGKGDLVAFDGEFVSIQAQKVVLNAEGEKVIKEEGRMLLARISLISDDHNANNDRSGKGYRLLVDDYILPSEPVIDYVTRFSGIVAEDLNPSQSRFAVVPYRTAYLKLRFFLDRGCIFVGHGLSKDFETANIFVPPDQVCVYVCGDIHIYIYVWCKYICMLYV